jgi:hypothetical protein
MKTFFVKNLIVVFALLLGIGTMSFKVSKMNAGVTENNQNLKWHFIPDVPGGEDDPENYEPGESIPDCPNATSVRCIIIAPELSPGVPDLDNAEVLNYKF